MSGDSMNYMTSELRHAFVTAENKRAAREKRKTRMMIIAGVLLMLATLGLIAIAERF